MISQFDDISLFYSRWVIFIDITYKDTSNMAIMIRHVSKLNAEINQKMRKQQVIIIAIADCITGRNKMINEYKNKAAMPTGDYNSYYRLHNW